MVYVLVNFVLFTQCMYIFIIVIAVQLTTDLSVVIVVLFFIIMH